MRTAGRYCRGDGRKCHRQSDTVRSTVVVAALLRMDVISRIRQNKISLDKAMRDKTLNQPVAVLDIEGRAEVTIDSQAR